MIVPLRQKQKKLSWQHCAFLLLYFASARAFSAELPICSSPTFDTDGDGWGWELNQSCIVSDTTADPVGSNFCLSASSDPDGDGWGWESLKSCKVAPVPDSSGPNPDEPGPSDGSGTPGDSAPEICITVSSDPDGDGWGWENNQSCRISAEDTAQPETPFTPVRIMAVGDSITEGYLAGSSTVSYRKELTQSLSQSGCHFQMIGSRLETHRPSGFESPHEGYSGHRVDSFIEGFGTNPGISATVGQFQPDVLLVHLGSNDMFLNQPVNGAYQSSGNGGTITEIKEFVAAAISARGSVKILLANVIPWFGVSAHNPDIAVDIETLGNEIEQYVQSIGNSAVTLVDVRSGYTADMMYSDGVHPNSKGESHIADAFLSGLAAIAACP